MSEEMDVQQSQENTKQWGFSFDARMRFYKFIEAVESNDATLMEECKRIYGILDDIVLKKEREQFITKLESGKKLYRARIINPMDGKKENSGIKITENNEFIGYNEINSREPMLGISKSGRNNVAGSSYMYVASNEQTACMEIKSQYGDLISLATFEVKKELEIIDFASEKQFSIGDNEIYEMSLGVFFTQLMLRFCEPVKNENAYKATQLIADYLRKTGVDAISYKSHLCPDGVNYTIFNSHPDNIKYVGSKGLIHKQANHSFWDFNEKCAILSNEEEKMMTYDEEIAKKHMKNIKVHFSRID